MGSLVTAEPIVRGTYRLSTNGFQHAMQAATVITPSTPSVAIILCSELSGKHKVQASIQLDSLPFPFLLAKDSAEITTMDYIMLYSLSLLFCVTLTTAEERRLLQRTRGIWKECARFREETSRVDQHNQVP